MLIKYLLLAVLAAAAVEAHAAGAGDGGADGQGASAGAGAGTGTVKPDAIAVEPAVKKPAGEKNVAVRVAADEAPADGARADEAAAEKVGDATQAKQGGEDAQQAALTVEEILKRDPERSEYVDDDRCISSHRIKSVDVIDQRHVAIRVSRNEHYLIQFERPCRDLHRNRPVFLERNTSRLCKMDRLWGSREAGLGRFEKGMMCHIPGFQSVTKEQIVLLKDALKAERRREREARSKS